MQFSSRIRLLDPCKDGNTRKSWSTDIIYIVRNYKQITDYYYYYNYCD
jgi:hypothetical protein